MRRPDPRTWCQQLSQQAFFGVKALTFGEHRYKREETAPSRLVTVGLKINETTTSKRGIVVLAITNFFLL